MRLYRVEDPEGKGPYQWGDAYASDKREDFVHMLCSAHTDYFKGGIHPGPYEDGLGFMFGNTEDWLFACPSVATLVEWFEGYWEGLHDLGFEIVTFDVEEDCVRLGDGKRQVIFDPDNATERRRASIREMLGSRP